MIFRPSALIVWILKSNIVKIYKERYVGLWNNNNNNNKNLRTCNPEIHSIINV